MSGEKTGKSRVHKPVRSDITIDDLNISGIDKKASAKLLQIVTAAVELFHWKGYGPTTTRDIGRACGISPGHIYYYIKSKDDIAAIFKAIHENDINKWEQSIRREIKRLPPGTLLSTAVRDYLHLLHLRRKMAIFWYHAATQVKPEYSADIRDLEKRIVNVFREIIELGCKEGRFHVSDPFLTACNIHMMCSTWALKRWVIEDRRTIDQYAGTCEELIITMVRGDLDPIPK
ncbi:MAG: TetR/AcrR family transcriptional regulator [Chloroflexi bacterium]|nr:TetR/AcrR family transcriptional regulator [Chloroflexota bacterium]